MSFISENEGGTYEELLDSISIVNAATNWMVAVPALLVCFKAYTKWPSDRAAFYLVGAALMLCASTASSFYHLDEGSHPKRIVDVVFASLLFFWTTILFVWMCFGDARKSLYVTLRLALFTVVASAAISIHATSNRDNVTNLNHAVERIVHTVWHLLASVSILLLVA